MNDLHIAFIQDALPFMGGAERVLAQALRAFPQAAVFTTVYNPWNFHNTPISSADVHTSFIDALPGAHRHHRSYFPLYPLAFERFDLKEYDLVVSFSYAASHGVQTRPGQTHIALYYTPLRMAYRGFQAYAGEKSLRNRILPALLSIFRAWDYRASQRPDQVYAFSRWAAGRVWQAYGRSARVLYPPVEIDRFTAQHPRDKYFICVSRMESHKRLDILVKAFNRSKRPLVLVGEGSEQKRLIRMAASNIRILDHQSDLQVAGLLSKARAFVHVAAEDFGIALVEAQAAGCPVIAFQKGGASETVIPGITGILFPHQSVECVNAAISQFETMEKWLSPADMRSSAERFSAANFRRNFTAIIQMNDLTPQIFPLSGLQPLEMKPVLQTDF